MTTTTKTYEVFYDKDTDKVVMDWHGYANSKEFKEGTELMLNTLIKNNTSKVLANIKEMTLIGTEDQKWLEDYFIPRAINFGFKFLAIIKPDYYFNKVAVESVSSKIDQSKLMINFFDNIPEAREWLARK